MTLLPARRHLAVLAAGVIMVGLIGVGAIRFEHFATPANLANLLGDYASVGIAAVGATFVIVSGGIDLSVGSVVAFTAVATASLVGRGWHPLAAGLICLGFGAGCGAAMGWLIERFELPPFIVTLVGMFAVRAGGFLVGGESRSIAHPFLERVSNGYELPIRAGATIPFRGGLLLLVVALGILMARSTRFGRHLFAIGGSRRSAERMGVPMMKTMVALYALAGGLSAVAGIVFAFSKRAGDPTAAQGLELTVIASVVIGGSRLSGGIGSVFGTLLGVLILGVIRLLIDFQGNLNSAWTSIAIGALLLGFVVLQRAIGSLGGRAATAIEGVTSVP